MLIAFAICKSKKEFCVKDSGNRVEVMFVLDHTDDRNKSWASSISTLTLTIMTKGGVADQFKVGARYALTVDSTDAARKDSSK